MCRDHQHSAQMLAADPRYVHPLHRAHMRS
jgi:hypothetical protein